MSDARLIQTTAEHPFMINEVGEDPINPELTFTHHDSLKEVTEQLEVQKTLND